ncbi:MAG: hypothetical protein U0232_27965 [Thermomicrobiales bacterium]
MATGWPEQLWVVRHAESVGNAACIAAQEAGEETIAVTIRDPDVPLGAWVGKRGRWDAGWCAILGVRPAFGDPGLALPPHARDGRTDRRGGRLALVRGAGIWCTGEGAAAAAAVAGRAAADPGHRR